MQITLESKPFAGVETEALVSYVFEESDPVQGRVAEIDHLGGGLLRRLAKSGELTGKMLELARPRPHQQQPRRVQTRRSVEERDIQPPPGEPPAPGPPEHQPPPRV